MEKLLVSMMKFSTAITLFGVEQMETTMRLMSGRENVTESMDRMRETLDSLTNAVIAEMDEKKKETLDSFVRASEDAMHQTMNSMNLGNVDLGGVFNATSDMMRRATGSMTDWVGTVAPQATNGGSEGKPEPAAEALSGSKTSRKTK